MVPDNIPRVGPTGRPEQPDPGSDTVSNDPAFRRMLERLEKLTDQSNPPMGSQTDNTDGFMDAMKKADENFIAAMDLRRKLEDAYRRNRP